MNKPGANHTIEEVRAYWDSHLNLTQFLADEEAILDEEGSELLYERLRPTLERYAYKPQLLRDFAAGCEGQKLIEIGCGLGVELAELGRLGFRVTGVDLAQNAIQLCNEHLKRQHVEGEAHVQNAEVLDFPDESFGAAYSCGVLQHTPDIHAAINEIWRVLEPDGRILIILYHRHSWFYLLQRVSGVNVEFVQEDAPIVNAYTRTELRSLFARFRQIRIRTEYSLPRPTPRQGTLAFLYNRGFVPMMRVLPKRLIVRYGWHLVLEARK